MYLHWKTVPVVFLCKFSQPSMKILAMEEEPSVAVFCRDVGERLCIEWCKSLAVRHA